MLADIEAKSAAKESSKSKSTLIKTDGVEEEKKHDSDEESEAKLVIDLT